MPLKVGDKVIYINNIAHDGNEYLLKRPSGVVRKVWLSSYTHTNMVSCQWDIPDNNFNYWNVPVSYVKLAK
jgi:hypothetical protein